VRCDGLWFLLNQQAGCRFGCQASEGTGHHGYLKQIRALGLRGKERALEKREPSCAYHRRAGNKVTSSVCRGCHTQSHGGWAGREPGLRLPLHHSRCFTALFVLGRPWELRGRDTHGKTARPLPLGRSEISSLVHEAGWWCVSTLYSSL
jgi:hypothetical protein